MGLEAELLQPVTRADAGRLALLLTDDFLEVGATGRAFGKADVLARLPHETGIGFTATDMQAHPLAPTTVLVTYRVRRTSEDTVTHSWRSSLWVMSAEGWRMRYHQGTYAEPVAPGGQSPQCLPSGMA